MLVTPATTAMNRISKIAELGNTDWSIDFGALRFSFFVHEVADWAHLNGAVKV
jgi:hypothetical protein